VLKEALRLYPPAPDMLFRTTTSEPAIIAGQTVPPHTSLTINLWAAHRSSQNFHRPAEFVPERWLDDCLAEFRNDDRAVFNPFSIGPRDCLGKRYGESPLPP
jgi:cytochrome P450